MKITDVKVYLAREWRTFCFVVVETDEGINGIGESGITGRELAVQGAIEHFKPLLIGQDPFRTEHIWQLLFRGGFFPAQRILTVGALRQWISRSGISRARRWACPCMSCWAGASATAC